MSATAARAAATVARVTGPRRSGRVAPGRRTAAARAAGSAAVKKSAP
ncbi:MAG: hypothetical protein H6745_33700 [Deltaproteobacteria bacterium]|nr:hypothetical protein [Deltaproteobacteria bacterium]